MLLKDHAAIVTGGASGLGAATARRLASQGALVALCDLNAKLAETVAAEIGGVAVVCDVSDAASAEAAVAAAAKAHGPARILVNCAGIGVAKRVIGRDGPMPLAEFDRVIRVNLIGSFNMLRLATAEMSKLEPLSTGVSAPARKCRRVRLPRTAYDRQPIFERRGGAARRIAAHGATVIVINVMKSAAPSEFKLSLSCDSNIRVE